MSTKTSQLHKALAESGWKKVESRSTRDCYSKDITMKTGGTQTWYAWPGERGNLRINSECKYTTSIAAGERFLKKFVFGS